jgi:hypothetical protein
MVGRMGRFVRIVCFFVLLITEFIRHINPKEQGPNRLCELREPHCMAAVDWVFIEV